MVKRKQPKKGRVSKKPVELEYPPAEPPKPLTIYQKAAAAFLAQNGYTHGARTKGCLMTRAATLIGYHRQTIHAWLKIPEFLQVIEMHQARYDAAASDGWMTLLRGIPEEGVLPQHGCGHRLEEESQPGGV